MRVNAEEYQFLREGLGIETAEDYHRLSAKERRKAGASMRRASRALGGHEELVQVRLVHRGWTLEEALSRPITRPRDEATRERDQQICARLGIKYSTLRCRLRKPDWDKETAYTTRRISSAEAGKLGAAKSPWKNEPAVPLHRQRKRKGRAAK